MAKIEAGLSWLVVDGGPSFLLQCDFLHIRVDWQGFLPCSREEIPSSADVRLDQQFGEKPHAFGRYDYALFRLLGVPAFGAAGGNGFGLGNTTGNTVTQNQSATIGADYAVKPSLLTDLRLGFLSYHVSESKYAGLTSAAALGIVTSTPANTVNPADTLSLPSFNFANTISPLGSQKCNCPLNQSEQVFH